MQLTVFSYHPVSALHEAEVASSPPSTAPTRAYRHSVGSALLKGHTVLGTSQGSSCPEEETTLETTTRRESSESTPPTNAAHHSTTATDNAYLNAAARAKENVERVERINSESDQRGRTWSIPVPSELQSSTPIWSGRIPWQRQVRETLNNDDGIQLCRRHNIDPERVFAVAVSMATVADQRTGRRVTASRDRLSELAGVSITVLKRARRVLSELGMAHEMVRGRYLRTIEQWAAEAHHGRTQMKATSVWALVSPKSAVVREDSSVSPTTTLADTKQIHASAPPPPLHPQHDSAGPQSVALAFSTSTSVRKYKTTRARAYAGTESSISNPAPRPIGLQKAAAELVSLAPILDTKGHIGSICDALRAHSVDTARWTGRDIAKALSEDTQRRGWTWPRAGALDSPLKFLHWRLARIDWSGPSPSERAAEAKHRREFERHRAAEIASSRDANVASQNIREASMCRIRTTLSRQGA